MFFRRRSAQAEYFDLPGKTESEVAACFRDLDHLNLTFRFSHPFVSTLPKWLGPARCAQLDFLDVGAGTGLLGKRLSEWARRRGWNWRFTNLDVNRTSLKLGRAPRVVVGSALALPFADGSFDVVIASQMTHHLSDQEILFHFREAWRVSKDALLICDLHRNAGFYSMLWIVTGLMRISVPMRADALLSVTRGFRLSEWRELARRAGLTNMRVWLYYGTRILLRARKRQH